MSLNDMASSNVTASPNDAVSHYENGITIDKESLNKATLLNDTLSPNDTVS
jgi:hypothetical protein